MNTTISNEAAIEALGWAKEIAGDEAEVEIHRGSNQNHVAIRVHGCWPETAKRIAGELAKKLNDRCAAEGFPAWRTTPKVEHAAGFVAVWL